MSSLQDRSLVVGMTPFEEPNAHLAVAIERRSGLGVIDLGRDAQRATDALADAGSWWGGGIGVPAPARVSDATVEHH